MRRTFITLILLLSSMPPWLSMSPRLSASVVPDEILRNAQLILRRTLEVPSTAIPAQVMVRARAIVVVPGARTDGEMYYGLGVMNTREDDPLRWTPLNVINFRGTIPVDLDAANADFILVALTPEGEASLTQGLPLPGSVRIHPGPLGEAWSEGLDADVVGYMAFADYFGGITIDNCTLVPMNGR